jgi:DNA mismatch repair protein MutL
MTAFEHLIQADSYPSYAIYLEMDPSSVDVNIHPTKQEVKFENERLLYQYITVSIRHSLGKYAAVPSMDFEGTPAYINPRAGGGSGRRLDSDFKSSRPDAAQWEKLFEQKQTPGSADETPGQVVIPSRWDKEETLDFGIQESIPPIQIHRTYILSQIKSGFILIHQNHAHFRVLYEQLLERRKSGNIPVQRLLFPETIQLNSIESGQFESLLPEFRKLGFEVESFGNEAFIVHGTPAMLPADLSVQQLATTLLDEIGRNIPGQTDIQASIIRRIARFGARQSGTSLTVEEMQQLIDSLFRCTDPYQTPDAKPCFIQYDLASLERRFKN